MDNSVFSDLDLCFDQFGLLYQDNTNGVAYNQQKFISYGSGSCESKTRVSAMSVSGESPLLVCR